MIMIERQPNLTAWLQDDIHTSNMHTHGVASDVIAVEDVQGIYVSLNA